MSSDERRSGIHRRDFLVRTTSGIGGGIAIGAAAALAAPATAKAGEQQPSDSGYRETDHVRKAYALARF